jgi:hypothetical protein
MFTAQEASNLAELRNNFDLTYGQDVVDYLLSDVLPKIKEAATSGMKHVKIGLVSHEILEPLQRAIGALHYKCASLNGDLSVSW